MRRSPLKRISKKREAILKQESILVAQMLEACEGKCMICGQKPDWLGLEKSHTRDRKVFKLSCAACHRPNNQHRYLDDCGIKLDK